MKCWFIAHLSAARSWFEESQLGENVLWDFSFHLHPEHIFSTHFYWEAFVGRTGIQDQALRATLWSEQASVGPSAGRLESGHSCFSNGRFYSTFNTPQPPRVFSLVSPSPSPDTTRASELVEDKSNWV
jgi:hypothetical protein